MPKDPPPRPPDSFLSSCVAAVTGRGVETKHFPWPVAVVLVLLSAVFGAVLWSRMTFVSQRAAKLASRLRKTREAQHRASGDARREANARRRAKFAMRAKRQKLRAEELERRMSARMEQKRQYSEELKKVATWDDLVIVDRRDD